MLVAVGQGQSALLRPRLLEPLGGRFGRRVTLVCAGPGFGKTTLVQQAMREARLARLGLDVPLTCTTDHALASQLVADLLEPLTGAPTGEAVLDPVKGADLVREAVWARAPDQVCLVLDDLHLLLPESPGELLLRRLLARLPGNGHLLLSSRQRPSLPTARLLAQGDAIVLDAAELAFTAEENVEFARMRGISAQTIAAAGGWPALAGLITGSGGGHVGSYLAEEVLHPMAPDEREALTLLAHLGGGDDALLSEVLGRRVRLAATVAGLPLVDGDEQGWWRLHELWRSALADAPAPAVVAAAAAAMHRRGRHREAMNLLLRSGDALQTWAQVAQIAVQTCGSISPLVPVDVLTSWHDRLPAARLDDPAAALLLGTAAKARDPDLAERELARAARAFRAADDLDGELAALLGRFHVAFARFDRPRMVEVAQRWGELAAAGVEAAAAQQHLGKALLASDLAEVAREVAALDALPGQAGGATVAWLRAHLQLLSLGDSHVAIAWCDRALPQAPATLLPAIRCERLEAFRHLGLLTQARAEARALDAQANTPRHLLALLTLEVVTGRLEPAADLLARLRSGAGASSLGWAPLALSIGEALLAVAEADEEAVPREGRQARDAGVAGAAGVAGVLGVLDDHPMARPAALLRIGPAALPLQYVLAPHTRAMWDAVDLRGVHARVRRLARIVALLQGPEASAGAAQAGRLPDEDLDLARCVLPIPWSVLLCTHAVAAGREAGAGVAKSVGPAARPTLHRLNAAGGPPARVAHRLLAAIPARPRHAVTLGVLGTLTVARDGRPVDDPHLARERVRQLIGLLVVRRAVPRAGAAAAIWPDLGEADAARNLRVTLNYVQRVLEPDRDERDPPFFLRSHGTVLQLADDPALDVDLWAFHADLDEADSAERRGAPSLALAAMQRALARWRGGLLVDLPSGEWLDQERELVRRRYVAAAVRLADLLAADGDLDRPQHLALTALEVEPWSEPAYDVLVATLLDRGDVAGARRALDRCFDMLDDLGVEAGPRSVGLAERIRHAGRSR